jgi:hypothetical protein
MPKRFLDDEDRLIRGSQPAEPTRRETEREPTSWRDRDRKKDRSAHTSADPREGKPAVSAPSRFAAEMQRKGNLSAANALFSNSAQETLEKKILAAAGESLPRLVEEYLQQYPLPASFELLARFVEHPSGEVVKQVLEQLEPMLPEQPVDKRNSLIQAVKLVGMMGRDPVARKAATSFVRRATASTAK